MKSLVAIALLSLCLALPAAATEVPAGREAKVRELLTLMRASDMAMQGIDGMIDAMKAVMPQVKEEYWVAFRAEIKPAEFIELLVPIYLANFEESDIEGLLQFYRSPVGRRFVDKQSVVFQQSMAAGQKWGEQVAQRALQQMRESQ